MKALQKMALALTVEQQKKLEKLDEEIKRKKEYDIKNLSRKEASSKATGIPIDIIDMDVIKIGTFLGLIKKKSILEGKEPNTTNYLLDLFLGNKSPQFDNSKIPLHYKTSQQKVMESEKIGYHQEFVEKQCTYYSEIVVNTIKTEILNIQKHIFINLEQFTIPVFVTVVKESMEVIFDELINSDSSEEEDELWKILYVLRNSLLGPLNICEYKKILIDQIFILLKYKPSKKIINNLSLIEARLILYPRCLNVIKGPLIQSDIMKLIRELHFRAFSKNPQLKSFEINDIIKDCCTPSLLNLPIEIVLKISMLGPYMNNSIGYLILNNSTANNSTLHSESRNFSAFNTNPWSFYVLNNINEDGSRLWVLDYKINIFSKIFITSVIQYLIKIFRVFYKEIFNTNNYIDNFNQTHHFDALLNVIKNIQFVSNFSFINFLKNIIIQKSCLIPTEYDFFNHLTNNENNDNENNNYDKNQILKSFQKNINNLFDTPITNYKIFYSN